MNLAVIIETTKWMSKAGYNREAIDLCNDAIDYLTKAEREGKDKIITYLPIWGEPIMTKYGKSKRVDGYDKKENKLIEFWKDRFFANILLFTQRYNKQMGIKPKKQKPFKRHGLDRTYMDVASFGTAGPGYRNHLD